jgi:hypothetical protein
MDVSNEITVNPGPSFWITQPIFAEKCEPAAGSSKATANGWSIKLMYPLECDVAHLTLKRTDHVLASQ